MSLFACLFFLGLFVHSFVFIPRSRGLDTEKQEQAKAQRRSDEWPTVDKAEKLLSVNKADKAHKHINNTYNQVSKLAIIQANKQAIKQHLDSLSI